MTLTAKQEAFAQAIADGKNQSDAYRTAYNAGKMKSETVQNSAYKLLRNGEVTARIKTLQQSLVDKSLWTRERSVKVLADIADSGESKAGEVVSAVKELNSMHGFNAPTKVDVAGSVSINVNFD